MVYRCRPGLDLLPTPCPGRADQRCPAHLSSPGIPELHRCAGFEPCQLFLSSTNTLLAVSSDTRAGFAFAISLGLKLSFPYNHPQPGPRLMLLNQCLCSCTPSLRLAHRKKETLSLSLNTPPIVGALSDAGCWLRARRACACLTRSLARLLLARLACLTAPRDQTGTLAEGSVVRT